MAALWRRLTEEEWGRLLGPCLITFAIPLLVPGFTITLVAISDDRGFAKFGALHVVGMVILALAVLLIIVGCVLRCKTKPSARVSSAVEGSDVTSLEGSPGPHTHQPFSTHAAASLIVQEGNSLHGFPRVTNQSDKKGTNTKHSSKANTSSSIANSPSTSETSLHVPHARDTRISSSAQNRLTHDMEAVLNSKGEDGRAKKTAQGTPRQISAEANYMSEDEENHGVTALQRMSERAAILEMMHNLDETSSYSSSASYSSSYTASEPDVLPAAPPQRPLQIDIDRSVTPGLSREDMQWANARAPVASLALLTANEFGPVDRGRRELTHMLTQDSDTELNNQDTLQRRDEILNEERSLQKESYERTVHDETTDDGENEAFERGAENSKAFSPHLQQVDMQRHGPPAYDSLALPAAELLERPDCRKLDDSIVPPDDTSSPDGQNSSGDSPSHGSYFLNSVTSERQSVGSQRISDDEVLDDNTQHKDDDLFTVTAGDTGLGSSLSVGEAARPLSPAVPLKRCMGISECRTTDSEAENVTVFSSCQTSMVKSSTSDGGSPGKHSQLTVEDGPISAAEDTDQRTCELVSEEEHERKRKKKKKRRRQKKGKSEDESLLLAAAAESEVMSHQKAESEVTSPLKAESYVTASPLKAESEVTSPQEAEEQDDLPLRSIMHPHPNPSVHVHWPDDQQPV